MSSVREEIAKTVRQRIMPAQKPGRSKQDYRTPRVFLDAVLRKWQEPFFTFDLAAQIDSAVSYGPWWFGPDHRTPAFRDSISASWKPIGHAAWLNPPFGDIQPFALKCADHPLGPEEKIFLLTPASVGSNWFAKYVYGKAHVYALQGRLSFDGKAPYPKDCILSVYGEPAGFSVWDWRRT